VFEALSSPLLRREDSELRWMLAAHSAAFLVLVALTTLRGGAGLLVLLASWLGGMAFGGMAIFREMQFPYRIPPEFVQVSSL